MMFVGRAVLGPVTERLGATRVLAAAVTGVPLGSALMAVPGPATLAAAGLMLLGLAAAPVFPLVTLTTETTQTVGPQVAASAVGSAAPPTGLGLVIGAASARVLAPALLVLSLAMAGLYLLRDARPRGRPTRISADNQHS